MSLFLGPSGGFQERVPWRLGRQGHGVLLGRGRVARVPARHGRLAATTGIQGLVRSCVDAFRGILAVFAGTRALADALELVFASELRRLENCYPGGRAVGVRVVAHHLNQVQPSARGGWPQ